MLNRRELLKVIKRSMGKDVQIVNRLYSVMIITPPLTGGADFFAAGIYALYGIHATSRYNRIVRIPLVNDCTVPYTL